MMDEHDDDLESTVAEGAELERDVFDTDEEPLGRADDKPLDDKAAPDDDTSSVDDAEL